MSVLPDGGAADRPLYVVCDFDGFVCDARYEKRQGWRSGRVRLSLDAVGTTPTEELKQRYPHAVEAYNTFMKDPRRTFHDKPVHGAGSAINGLIRDGYSVAIVTSRHNDLRAGTLASIRRFGSQHRFGDPADQQDHKAEHLLYMSTLAPGHDTDAKKMALTNLRRRGNVLLGTGDRPEDADIYHEHRIPAIILRDPRFQKGDYERYKLPGKDGQPRSAVFFIKRLSELRGMVEKVSNRFEPLEAALAE